MKISEADIAALRTLEESLWRAETRFDVEYMDKILTPDFFEFGRSGRIYNREEILAASGEEIRATFPLKDFTVHEVEKNVALVTYVSEVTFESLEIGNRSSLWIKTPDGWNLRFHQGTAVQTAH